MTPITPSKARRRLFRRPVSLAVAGVVLVGLLAAWGWRWYTTPVPPQLSLDGLEPAIVEAVTEALEEVRLDPRSGAAWGQLGKVLEAHAIYHPAADCLLQAARLDPQEPRWPYLLGIQLASEDAEKALPYLSQAVELAARSDQFNSAPRLRLAEVLVQLDRGEEAEAEYLEVLRQEPNNPRAYYGLGLVAVARDDVKAAEENLLRAARSPFCRRKASAQLARLAQRRGSAEAAEFSRQAVQLPMDLTWRDPYVEECVRLDRGPTGRFRQVQMLEALGLGEETTEVYRELARTSPGTPSSLALGTALARAGDTAGAEAAFRQALGQPEFQVAAWFSLGALLCEQAEDLWHRPGQREQARVLAAEAVELLRQALQRKPDHALAHLKLGQALRLLGQRPQAIRSFQAGLECRPELAEGHLLLGQTLLEDGQTEAALRSLEEAVRLSEPKDTRARNALEQARRKKQS